MKTQRYTIDIPQDIYEAIKTIAFFKKVSMKEILVDKMKEVIKEEKEKGNISEVTES